MIRLTTFIILVVALGTSLALFMLKYEVQDLEDELAQLNRSVVAHEEAIRVLDAEWSHLNNPARLRTLARRHLGLKPVHGWQLRRVSEVPLRVDVEAAKAAAEAAKAGPKHNVSLVEGGDPL